MGRYMVEIGDPEQAGLILHGQLSIRNGRNRPAISILSPMLRRFLNELRHRRVLRTAAAYAIAAAAMVEILDIVVPNLGLPGQWVTFAIIAALVGFPVVIALAWSFDWTSEGLTAGTPATVSTAQRSHVLSWLLIGVLTVAVSFLSYKLWQVSGAKDGFEIQTPTLIHGKSIAVLPFADISDINEADSAYFSDGIAEEIRSALAAVDGLRVAARTSAFSLREQSQDVPAIGEALQVSYVLEGSVRRADDRLRVSAQLIDSGNGFGIWSEVFDYTAADVFRVQEEIARSIVGALELELAVTGPMVQPGTSNTAAYELYLKGRHLLEARRLERAYEAVALFEQAIELDPDFAEAFAGLADAWILIRGIGNLSQFEATQRSHVAISKALQIDNQLPEAQTSLGLCILGGGDRDDAIAQFDRALEFDPDYVAAHMWRANTLRDQGHLSAAALAYNQALALDPLNPAVIEEQALLFAYQGFFDAAVAQLATLTARDDQRLATALMTSRVAALAGDYNRASTAAQRGYAIASEDPEAMAALIAVHARLADSADARSLLDRALELAPNNETVLLTALDTYLRAGDHDALDALAWSRAEPMINTQLFQGTATHYERLVWAATSRLLHDDADKALNYLELAMPDPNALNPHPTSVHRIALLTRARKLTGDTDGAKAALNSGLQLAGQARSEGWGAGHLNYALAALTAAAGQTSVAIEHLRAASDAGWLDVVFAKHDPAITDLRTQPEYQTLVGK